MSCENKDIVKSYGLRKLSAAYRVGNDLLILQRIDDKRIVFTTAGDRTDSTELWVSISPTEVRLHPRNLENYIENTVFNNPLPECNPDEKWPYRDMVEIAAYYRHKNFYLDLMGYWSGKVTMIGESGFPDIQYIFYMKDCGNRQMAEFIPAIYYDVIERADDKELPYVNLDRREHRVR